MIQQIIKSLKKNYSIIVKIQFKFSYTWDEI